MSRRLACCLAAVCGLLFALTVVNAPAQAATSYQHIGEFGGGGTGPGLFATSMVPQRIAVHDPSGKVFVADRGNNRVQVLNPTPTGLAFGFSIAVTGPAGVALDPVDGSLYVTGNSAIFKFTPDSSVNPTAYTADASFVTPPVGANPGEIGALRAGNNPVPNRAAIAVDPVTRDILVIDTTKNVIHRYDRGGWQAGAGYLGSLNGASVAPARGAFTSLFDISVTADGDIVTADVIGSGARVDRYAADGTLLATLTDNGVPVPNTMPLASSGIIVAASRLTGEVLVSSKNGVAISPESGKLYQFVDDLPDGTVTVANDRFSGVGMFGAATTSSGADRLYVLATQAAIGPIPRIQIFEPPSAPEVTVEPPTSITATGANFAGTVTAGGGQTTWRFEYRPVGASTWQSAPQPDGDLGDQPGTYDVAHEVAGLEPNLEYELRLAGTTRNQTAYTDPLTFRTAVGAPVVQTRTATQITEAGAILRGRVNPRNSATTYAFEWGTDTGYGNVVPLTPRSVGAGGATLPVAEALTGLEPGTTYHYRLVATNDHEPPMDGVGDDLTFTTRVAPLPERGYEIVSQMPTGGSHMDVVTAGESEDGNRVLYYPAPGHDPLSGFDLAHLWYFAERTATGPTGWTTTGVDLPRFGGQGADTFNSILTDPNLQRDRIVVKTTAPLDPDDANADPHDVPIGRDLYQWQPDGSVRWITRDPRIPPGTPQTNPASVFEGSSTTKTGGPLATMMSADGDTFVFPSGRTMLDADTTSTGCQRLYKWEDGLRLVGIRPDGSVPNYGGPGDNCSQVGTLYAPNAVSRDGSRVFWSARRHDLAQQSLSLYVDDDGTTVEASAEAGVAPLPSPHPLGVAYQGADVAGDRVFFTSRSRLTPNSGGSNSAAVEHADLYVYDVAARELRNLTPRLDGGTDPGVDPAVADRARVRGVVAMSDDARRVYFVADAALDARPSPLGAAPVAGSPNLYLAELNDAGLEGLRFVATLGGTGGTEDLNLWSGSWSGRTGLASPDGRMLGFGSVASVTGDATGGTRQVYVYDDVADTLECASCPADGSPPAGNVNRAVSNAGSGSHAIGWQESRIQAPFTVKRWVSSTGTVFFDTPTALVAEDKNAVNDVYEYDRGTLRLITTGDSSGAPATFSGASLDGTTVFFTSTDALAPQDREPGVRKIYAARVGGGFAPAVVDPPCAGDACQGPPAQPPAAREPGSSSWSGTGSPVPSRRASQALAVRLPSGRGAVATVRVRVPAAGRITVRGAAVRNGGRSVGRAGWHRVRVALAPVSRKRLARRGRMTVSVRLTFAPRGGPAVRRSLRLSYRRPLAVAKPAAARVAADPSTTGGDR